MTKQTAIAKLVKAINALLETKRAQERKLCKDIQIEFDGWGKDILVRPNHEGTDVWLAYDGDGFHDFSLESDTPYLMAEAASEFGWSVDLDNWDGPPMRNKVIELAKSLGFHAEDCNNWSMGFYFEG
jgi:hypothetical protein